MFKRIAKIWYSVNISMHLPYNASTKLINVECNSLNLTERKVPRCRYVLRHEDDQG